ncbi:hypothetical protein D3C72_677480 [compost metagenome]
MVFRIKTLVKSILHKKQQFLLGFSYAFIHLFLFIVLILLSISVRAQDAHAYIDLSISPKKVYAGQPAILTYTVYTDQYFTQPPEVSNLQMNGAFLVPYDRSYSITLQKNGKNMPAIQFMFRIFPVEAGKLVLPPLKFTVTVPTEKNPLGVERKIQSHGLTLNVLNPPGGPPGESIVGTSATLNEKWSRPLTTIKEGDVVERDITIHAGGTVAGLLPSVKLDSLDWAQIYEGTPITKDNRPPGSNAISAYRTERFKYLFSKTGKHKLPEIEINYWNLSTHRLTKLKIPEHEIDVKENKNLGMLRSIQDSIDEAFLKATDPKTAKATPKTYLGLTPKQWLFLLISLGILWFIIRRMILPLFRFVRNKFYSYKKTEAYLFKKLKWKAFFGKQKETYNLLNQWLLTLPGNVKTLKDLANETSMPELNQLAQKINNELFESNAAESAALKHATLFPLLSKARKIQLDNYNPKKEQQDYTVLNWTTDENS